MPVYDNTGAAVGGSAAGGGIPSNKAGLLTHDGSEQVELAVGTDGQILSADSSQSSGLAWINNFQHAILEDQKTQGTNGGTYTTGAWQTRDLGAEVYDPDGIVSLSSNQFTPAAGDYIMICVQAVRGTGDTQARLYNATGASEVFPGIARFVSASNADGANIHCSGKFTASASTAYEIQIRGSNTRATDGLGRRANVTTEIYTQVILVKIG
jgi:hypothetical protein